MKGELSWEMLREHRWSYAGLAIVLVVASALVGSSFIFFEGARTSDVDVSGLVPDDARQLLVSMENGRFVSGFMAVLGAFVAVFLVSQTMGFIVDGRRRELAMLRLAGASPPQVTKMVLMESVIIGVLCSVIGAFVALLLTGPYAELLSQQGSWPPGMPVRIHASALIWCVVLMTLVSTVGAFGAARRIGRTPPIEAVQSVSVTRSPMSPVRWVFAGIGMILVGVSLALPAQSTSIYVLAAAVGGGAVLLVTAMAPVIVPPVARVLGGALMVVAPGAGLVAREHTAHDARRTAALASPIIVLLGLSVVFAMVSQTGRSVESVGKRELTNTHAVVEFPAHQLHVEAFYAAKELTEIESVTRVQHVNDWGWSEPDRPQDDYVGLMGIDPATVSHFVPLKFATGSIDDITGNNVAAISGTAKVGDSLNLSTPEGDNFVVQVVATVEPTTFVYGDFLVDQHSFPLDTETMEDTWLVESASGVSDEHLVAALNTVTPSAEALTLSAWVDRSVDRSVAAQRATIVTIIGGATLLALFNLAQATLASVRERRAELTLLTMIGARRRSVTASLLVESGITSAAAALLAIVVAVLVYIRVDSVLTAIDPALSPILPIGFLTLVLAACIATSAGSAAAGAALALRGNTTRKTT